MDYNRLLASMKKFGATAEEICLNTLGIRADCICEKVVVSPGWQPERLFAVDEIELVVQSSPLFGFKIWNVNHKGVCITYIRTGFGAPMMMDALLLLGLTKCKRVIFISSVGALSTEINIGDIVIPEYSAGGDGASRYLANDLLSDSFGEKQYPDNNLFNLLVEKTKDICGKNNVNWHLGRTLCVDTIVAQYNHLENIIHMGYNSIDMESAVAFKVGKLMGIQVVALLHVSDNSVIDKSLMTDRSTQEERKYRAFVRNEILPKIVEGMFSV